jgi:hypothetical protein
MTSVKRLASLTLALFVLPSVALATGDPNDETERLNRADMALAKQTAVQRSDLSTGWRLTRSGLPPPDDSGFRCAFDPDLSAFVITGKHQTRFSHGTTGAQLVSGVGVFRNVRDAAGDFRASAKPGLLPCLKRALLAGLRQAHVRARITTSRMSRTPRVGAQSVFYRVVATTYPTQSLPSFKMYMDFLAFRRGRSQATLLFTAGRAPVQGQVALARLVQSRMK